MKRRSGFLVLGLLMACSGITVPSDPASQEGVIVGRDRSTSFDKDRPTIWVKDDVDDECGVIYVIVPRTELFTRGPHGQVRPIEVVDLKTGAAVRVWTDLILTSCPAQATAQAVELLAGD